MNKQMEKQTEIGRGVGFERIRRITGYLVGTMDKWNDAKRAAGGKISGLCSAAHAEFWAQAAARSEYGNGGGSGNLLPPNRCCPPVNQVSYRIEGEN